METLLDWILSSSNINQAIKNVKSNKGASGIDGMKVSQIEKYLMEHKDNIFEDIRLRKYNPQPILRVEIPKEDGGVRKLGIPTVIDRVIQQAITQVLTPIYENGKFSDNSFGYRPQRSCEKAILRSLEYINDGYDWIVDIDLERFFDTINHDRIIRLVSNTINDGDVISLIRKYLRAPISENGVLHKPTQGAI